MMIDNNKLAMCVAMCEQLNNNCYCSNNYYYYTAQPPVIIEGETTVSEGGELELRCLLIDGGIPYDPQWNKASDSLPDHVIVV